MTTPSLALFIVSSLVLLLTPGPAVLYIIARSINQGRQAGVVSAVGLSLGTLVHVFAAAFGLSALLATSAIAFNVVKLLGAAYLIYLGIKTLRTPLPTDTTVEAPPRQLKQIFVQGFIVNVLNPKLALFFFAYLPQFVDMSSGSVAGQIVMLGMIFTALGIISDSLYAIVSGTLGRWLKNNPTFVKMQRTVSGVVYIFLGATTALAGADTKS
ncbi:MAG: LysE family translocator [Anaerolineae bacterium]|nr:LysE family translocator [Anaerolineae bacterium]MCA9891108.1 LysE family translocator [Anaerolineae bacterium]MCA9895430.1 LysE family translocator [Anaerolineae bacterium]MCB9461247.1 LysE family translocator [Anaerolineaceae bacterium]